MNKEDIIRLSYKVFRDEWKYDIVNQHILHRRIYDSCWSDAETRKSIIGWPSHPLYKEIGSMVFQWIENNRCPILDLPTYEHRVDNAYIKERNALIEETLNPMLARMKSLWKDWSEDEKLWHVKEFYNRLGKRGQMDLLGFRKTTGDVDMWPPSKGELLQMFNDDHSTREDLTVGAVAISELGHKDLSKTWWGSATEGGVVKDDLASALCAKVLDTATWISINEVPNDHNEIEVRQENGYGMKWRLYGSDFKCVVEPEMVDGQVVGWKK